MVYDEAGWIICMGIAFFSPNDWRNLGFFCEDSYINVNGDNSVVCCRVYNNTQGYTRTQKRLEVATQLTRCSSSLGLNHYFLSQCIKPQFEAFK